MQVLYCPACKRRFAHPSDDFTVPPHRDRVKGGPCRWSGIRGGVTDTLNKTLSQFQTRLAIRLAFESDERLRVFLQGQGPEQQESAGIASYTDDLDEFTAQAPYRTLPPEVVGWMIRSGELIEVGSILPLDLRWFGLGEGPRRRASGKPGRGSQLRDDRQDRPTRLADA